MPNMTELTKNFAALLVTKGCNVEKSEIQHADRLTVQLGRDKGIVDLFTTGTIRVGGKDSPLKNMLQDIVDRQQENPEYVYSELEAHGHSDSESSSVAVGYNSSLFIADRAVHDTIKKDLKSRYNFLQEDSEGNLISECAVVYFNEDQIVAEGLDAEIKNLSETIITHGARLEESAWTQFKDLLPQIASRWSPQTISLAESKAKEILGRELFDFLPAHDRRAYVSAIMVLEIGLPLMEMCPVIMPVGRVFEGFTGKILLKLGLITSVKLQDPKYSFGAAFRFWRFKKI